MSFSDELSRLRPPRLADAVHREECTQCFDNQDGSAGIEVCLTCFNGACPQHAQIHIQRAGHTYTLNVKRKLKPSMGRNRAEDEEPPAKMTRLAIVEENEADKYETSTEVRRWSDGTHVVVDEPQIKPLVDGVMQSMSSGRQSEVKAWEEEINPCEHTLLLEQLPNEKTSLTHCVSCDLTSNLWLCLTCGALGCGRAQFGGVDGNGHALAHYEATHHPVAVKLGTITPEGSADLYCYACNDATIDPSIASHLRTFGIRVEQETKTEKSMTELQIEENLKYDFSLTSEDGKAFEPLGGASLTGLGNLGNSCYMASVLQTIFSLPVFQQRYHSDTQTGKDVDHASSCPESLPADCVECQMRKVADGLLSGRYSSMPTEQNGPPNAPSIKPTSFKSLIGKGHAEFATMKQQDAEEFFGWLINVVRRDGVKYHDRVVNDPTKTFTYSLEQRLQCTSCNKVRYRTDDMDVVSVSVPAIALPASDAEEKVKYKEAHLTDCIDSVIGGLEELEYACPECRRNVIARKRTLFASFPDTLVVHAKKFQLINWVPSKLDIPLILPDDDTLVFDASKLGKGLQDGEVALPEDAAVTTSAPGFVPSPNALANLEAMGFPTIRCTKALQATGNTEDVEVAMEWLIMHMEDPDIDDPIPATTGAGSAAPEPPAEQVEMLADMGFSHAQAKKALRETGGNAEGAVEWLFNHPDDMGDEPTSSSSIVPVPLASAPLPGSTAVPAVYRLKAFISHKGPSVHSGHYVAHIKKETGWVLFNDEKVVKADEESVSELKKFPYLYVFERV